MSVQEFGRAGRFNEFILEPLSSAKASHNFDCGIHEYNDYLFSDALRSPNPQHVDKICQLA